MKKSKYRQSDLSFAISPSDADSKQAILRAALHLFVDAGVETTSIRAIAAEAGYSNPVIFKFFADKDALTLYLFEHCYSHLYSRVRSAIAPTAPLEANVRAWVREFGRFAREDLEVLLFVQDHLRTLWPRSNVKNQSLVDLVTQVLAADNPKVRPPALELQVAAWLGTAAQVARFIYFGEVDPSHPDFERELSATLVGALRR